MNCQFSPAVTSVGSSSLKEPSEALVWSSHTVAFRKPGSLFLHFVGSRLQPPVQPTLCLLQPQFVSTSALAGPPHDAIFPPLTAFIGTHSASSFSPGSAVRKKSLLHPFLGLVQRVLLLFASGSWVWVECNQKKKLETRAALAECDGASVHWQYETVNLISKCVKGVSIHNTTEFH